MNVQPQHVIITGGSSGIGKATGQLLASQGANLSLIARDPAKLERAKAEILQRCVTVNPQINPKIFTVSADVSDRHQATTAIETAIAHQGAPDILITSAGIAHPGYFQALPTDIFEQTMAINYFGTLYCIKAALPAMQQQQRGHIVLISSGAGLVGIYGYTSYSPSKFALRGLAEALRGELKPIGIRVAIVYPPDTDTPQLAAENLTKPPETKQITATAEVWSADAVAQKIVQGIQKNQFAIAPGSEMQILNRFHSLLNPVLHKYFDSLVTKVRNQNP
ncbi:MAG: SDR family oxidoreductase [Oculatellaceae cyanobacterium Prado106]|jgi:3-dehydrosphinganine reductase|nr:SDR family oxidoreductase [Oculatellaceae cyanobacterium Prado106]